MANFESESSVTDIVLLLMFSGCLNDLHQPVAKEKGRLNKIVFAILKNGSSLAKLLIALPNGTSYGKIYDLQRRIALYEDAAAYKDLFFTLFSSLTRFANSIIHSREIAEEIVSDVFIQIWNNRTKLSEIEDLRLYLFIAVKNNAIRKHKQQQRHTTLSIDDLKIEMDSIYLNPEQQFISEETVRSVEQAVEQLPPRAKLIFKLAKEDRMRYKDIAALLNISVKTVDHQLAISLKKIANTIGAAMRKKAK